MFNIHVLGIYIGVRYTKEGFVFSSLLLEEEYVILFPLVMSCWCTVVS